MSRSTANKHHSSQIRAYSQLLSYRVIVYKLSVKTQLSAARRRSYKIFLKYLMKFNVIDTIANQLHIKNTRTLFPQLNFSNHFNVMHKLSSYDIGIQFTIARYFSL